jgi:hypothetical protein
MSLRHSILILSQSLLLQQSTGRHVTQTQYSDSEPVFTLTTVHEMITDCLPLEDCPEFGNFVIALTCNSGRENT